MDSKDIINKIANKVNEVGGRTFYVGGYVRDELLGIDSKDVDIEVHGVNEKQLYNILSSIGEPLTYGKSFGIYSLKGYNVDIALPRIEVKKGSKHNEFDVSVNPYIDLVSAIKRRDFTINAIYKDVLTNEIIDPFNGVIDLENKLIRHIDDISFVEDPLRVLRACQFASRFEFEISKKTIQLCRGIDISSLSKQRINEELRKALLQSSKPSLFFTNLDNMNQLNYWFKNIDINKIKVDEASKYISEVENKYAYMLSSITCFVDYDLNRILDEKDIIEYCNNMSKHINDDVNNDYDFNKLYYSLINPHDYIYLKVLIDNDLNKYINKYEDYLKLINKPYVMGKDLLNLGYVPGEYFSEALKYANELRLQGIDRQEALIRVNEYIKNVNKKGN